MSLSKAERETIIRWSADPDEPMTVYTHSTAGKRRMERLGAELVRVTKIDGRAVAWTYTLSRDCFAWPRRKRTSQSRPMPEAARRAQGQKTTSGGQV